MRVLSSSLKVAEAKAAEKAAAAERKAAERAAAKEAARLAREKEREKERKERQELAKKMLPVQVWIVICHTLKVVSPSLDHLSRDYLSLLWQVASLVSKGLLPSPGGSLPPGGAAPQAASHSWAALPVDESTLPRIPPPAPEPLVSLLGLPTGGNVGGLEARVAAATMSDADIDRMMQVLYHHSTAGSDVLDSI